jgi:phosphoglycolate phosphatase-like HAD superfamily hydrolase
MPIDPGKIRALCFDLDGTLSDTDDLYIHRLLRWSKPLQGMFPESRLAALARRLVMGLESPGNRMYSLADRLGIDQPLYRLASLVPRRRAADRAQFLMIPGVQETLAAFAARYPMSIVSARGRTGTLAFLETFSLGDYFQAVATAGTCPRTKPHPAPIYWAAEQMGVRPAECLMIGDTVVDILAGVAAGAQTVGVLCGFGDERELRRAGADVILNSTADLPVFLASLGAA